jgi:hypothetical protein
MCGVVTPFWHHLEEEAEQGLLYYLNDPWEGKKKESLK